MNKIYVDYVYGLVTKNYRIFPRGMIDVSVLRHVNYYEFLSETIKYETCFCANLKECKQKFKVIVLKNHHSKII